MSLGSMIKKARADAGLSLRAVEHASNKEISNGYLSLLESDAIKDPSPKMLHTLSRVLGLDYTELMRQAGYVAPTTPSENDSSGQLVATAFSADDLTPEERKKVEWYIDMLRKEKQSLANPG